MPWSRIARASAFAPYLLVSLVHLATKLTGATELDHATKPLLMPALALGVTLLLTVGRARLRPVVVILLLAGVLLSWLGDVFLEDFVVGLSFFFAAHAAYISLFWRAYRQRPTWWALLVLPWFVALMWALGPSLGDLYVVVALYGAILGLMAVAATTGNLLTTLGGVLFLVSDSFLAFRLFTPLFQDAVSDFLIMLSYLAAQLLIALGVLRTAIPSAHDERAHRMGDPELPAAGGDR